MPKSQLSISKLIPSQSPRRGEGDQSPRPSFLRSLSLSLSPGSLRQAEEGGVLIPRHAEDETGTMLGEIRLGLVNLGFHGDGAFPPVQAALDRVGDADLQSAFLTAEAKREEKKSQAGGRGWGCRRSDLGAAFSGPAASPAPRVAPTRSSEHGGRARSGPAPPRQSLPRGDGGTGARSRRGNITSQGRRRSGATRTPGHLPSNRSPPL